MLSSGIGSFLAFRGWGDGGVGEFVGTGGERRCGGSVKGSLGPKKLSKGLSLLDWVSDDSEDGDEGTDEGTDVALCVMVSARDREAKRPFIRFWYFQASVADFGCFRRFDDTGRKGLKHKTQDSGLRTQDARRRTQDTSSGLGRVKVRISLSSPDGKVVGRKMMMYSLLVVLSTCSDHVLII
jgi:hypothetical protein